MTQSAADINWDAEKKSKGFFRVPSQSHKGSSSPEATRFSANSPRLWMRGQAMVEMGIVAPIVVLGMLMWTQINQMTSTQHRLMASVYEGTKVISQFSDLYILECLNTEELKAKVMELCKSELSESECAAHFSGSEDGESSREDEKSGMSEEEKGRFLEDLDKLLLRKTLCQTLKERVTQVMSYWKLSTGSEDPPPYTFVLVHYCKDGSENVYEDCLSMPGDTEVDEFVGLEVTYPKSYVLGRMFGVTSHKSKSVTLLRSYQTPSGGGSGKNDDMCSFAIRSGMSVRYFCGQ